MFPAQYSAGESGWNGTVVAQLALGIDFKQLRDNSNLHN